MSFTLFFPSQGMEGAYKDLEDEDDVYAAIKEEVEKAVSGMGSAGYELVWPKNIDVSRINDMPQAEQEEVVLRAHQLGVDQAVTMHAPGIHKQLWIRYLTLPGGETDIATNNTTYSKLPDGTTIALREEHDDDNDGD